MAFESGDPFSEYLCLLGMQRILAQFLQVAFEDILLLHWRVIPWFPETLFRAGYLEVQTPM